MDQDIIRHKNALSSWIALRVGRDGAVARILRIETDLTLDASDRAHRADKLNELLEAEFPEGDYDTVGGLVYYLLGHVPSEGETVDYDGRRLRAERVQGRRIGRVRISKLEPVSDRE